MTTEFKHLNNEQLLDEIKRQWYEKDQFDYELMQLSEEEAFTPANDYLSSDIEQHIERLENEYKRRGLKLPNRDEYIAQFMPNEETDE